MDEICESQDYYRKHVANDGESLYRSISDSVFGSQNYKFIVAKAVELIMNEASSDEKNILSEFAPNYPLVCRLGTIHILRNSLTLLRKHLYSTKLNLTKYLICISQKLSFSVKTK